MSEEKLYAVKNHDCEWADSKHIFGYGAWATPYKAQHEEYAKRHGGHVVTLIEEPEKVVLTKEQAEIVECAHYSSCPATYISNRSGVFVENGEELLMSAYINGYIVVKEKKYYVKVPHSEGWHFQKYSSTSKLGSRNNWKPFPTKDIDSNSSKELFQFTEEDIEKYGLQDCERVECDNDD